MLERVWEKGTLLHCWWGCKLVQPLWRTVWRFLRKLKIELPYDPAIPLLGIYADKTIIRKHTHPSVHSTIHNSQDMETTQMSIDRWMDKGDVVHIYNGILLSHKKEWNNAICSNMNGPRDYHTKWSQSERERQIPYDITYMWDLKSDTNELTCEIETDSWLPRRGGWGEGWTGNLGLVDANYYI